MELENQYEEQQIAGLKELDIISAMTISLSDHSKKKFCHLEEDTRLRTIGIIEQVALKIKDGINWLMLFASQSHAQYSG